MIDRENRDLYADEWRHMQGIVECGYEFGPQRQFSGTAPTAPSEGVRCTINDPSQKQIVAASAAQIGYNATDKVFTIFAKTLDEDFAWEPLPDDRLILLDQDTGNAYERWIIKSVVTGMFGAQYVCMCRKSPLTRNPANAAPT